MTFTRKAMALGAAAILVLIGCAPSDTAESSAGSGDETLVFGATNRPGSLDPHKTTYFSDCLMLCLVYDRLVHAAPDGTLEPGLADSWEYSDDGMDLTFRLNEGATFADGTAVDADAVKASLDRARTLEDSTVIEDFRTVEDITVEDSATVTLHLSEPDASIPGILSGLSGVIINPVAFEGDVDLGATMAGAGAYEFVSYSPEGDLELVRRDDYWGEEPDLETVEFTFVADAAALANALLAGQIDAANILPQNLTPFLEDEAFTIAEAPVLQQYPLLVNHALTGLDDERVRKAILHGLDRQAICDTVYAGYCEVTDQPFPSGFYAYDDTLQDPLYEYDPDAARALLEEAAATDLTLDLVVPPVGAQLAEAMQAQLKEIGVTMNIQQVEPGAMFQQFLIDKTAQGTVVQFTGRTDPTQMLSARHSATGLYNPSGYSPPELAALIEDSKVTIDPDARTEVLRQASREAAETALPLALGFSTRVYVMKQGIEFPVYVSGLQELRLATVE